MRTDIVTLAKKLIKVESIDSSPENLRKVLEIAKQELDGLSFKDYKKNGYSSLLFSNKGFDKQFTLILNGHLDVVPGNPEQFIPLEKENRLYERGSADMKTAAATMILIFKELSNKVDFPFGLQLVTDEEMGGGNGTRFQLDEGVRSDFVIAGEFTNLSVCNETKGIIQVKITIPGITAHSAYQWQGENAINRMGDVIQQIKTEFPELTEEIWRSTANIATIQTTNVTSNKVPNDCTIVVDIRYIPTELELVEQKLKSIVPEDATIEYIEKEPAQFTDVIDSYLEKFLTSAEQTLGKKPDVIKKHGGSDVRSFNAIGCPGIQFGPKGSGIHTDNEFVDLDSLENYYSVLKNFVTSLM